MTMIMTDTILTGVIQNNNIEWLGDETADSIDIDFEEAYEDHLKECPEDSECAGQSHQEFTDECEIDCPTYLIGSWKKNEFGQYEPDTSGEYAAINRETVTQVVWSKRVVDVRSMCSPCYPMQADYDSGVVGDGEGIKCYALPLDVIGFNEEETKGE